MAIVNPVNSSLGFDVNNLTKRAVEIKVVEEQKANVRHAQLQNKKTATSNETQRPVNPASRAGLNIDIKV